MKRNNKGYQMKKDEIEKLSKKFSQMLADEIGDDAMQELIHKTVEFKTSSICASHDYCDANVIMMEAFESVFDKEYLLHDRKHNETVELAWSMAKENDFYYE